MKGIKLDKVFWVFEYFIKKYWCISNKVLNIIQESRFVVSCTLAIVMIAIFGEDEFAEEQVKNYDQEAYADPEKSW